MEEQTEIKQVKKKKPKKIKQKDENAVDADLKLEGQKKVKQIRKKKLTKIKDKEKEEANLNPDQEMQEVKQVKKRKSRKPKQEGAIEPDSKLKKLKKVKEVKIKKPKRVKHQGKGRKAYLDPDPKFKVPKHLYEQVFDEIQNPPSKKPYENNVLLLCHSNPKENFCVITKNGLNKSANFLKAAKEALEMRDFKSLYKICIKGFEINDKLLNKVLYEVIFKLFYLGYKFFKS